MAAGNGTRLWPLTTSVPKPFLPILGKSIIERKLDILSDFVNEAVLIVGKNKEKIKEGLGEEYKGLRIKYVEQEERLGTGHALKCAEKVLKERFLVLNGDDIYGRTGLENALGKFPCILVKKVKDISDYGAAVVEGEFLKGIVEKPKENVSEWANIGVYHLPKEVLDAEIEMSERGEYEITDFAQNLARTREVYWVEARDWKPVTYPWDLLAANQIFLQDVRRKIKGKVEKGARVEGKVFVGERSVIRSGAYVKGPVFIGKGCDVGPNCYIRPLSVINNKCRVGQAVEIKSSLLQEKSRVAHLSYVGDSVVGRNCNLGAGTVIANLRFDEKEVKAMVCGKLVGTGRRKLGAFLGDNVKVGIHVSLMPGVMVAPGCHISPHSLVKRNVYE